jgi:hypothetical protein
MEPRRKGIDFHLEVGGTSERTGWRMASTKQIRGLGVKPLCTTPGQRAAEPGARGLRELAGCGKGNVLGMRGRVVGFVEEGVDRRPAWKSWADTIILLQQSLASWENLKDKRDQGM